MSDLAGHPMICGAVFKGTVAGLGHDHVCGQPVRRPDQTDGIPEHKCRGCDCTWVEMSKPTGVLTALPNAAKPGPADPSWLTGALDELFKAHRYEPRWH